VFFYIGGMLTRRKVLFGSVLDIFYILIYKKEGDLKHKLATAIRERKSYKSYTRIPYFQSVTQVSCQQLDFNALQNSECEWMSR